MSEHFVIVSKLTNRGVVGALIDAPAASSVVNVSTADAASVALTLFAADGTSVFSENIAIDGNGYGKSSDLVPHMTGNHALVRIYSRIDSSVVVEQSGSRHEDVIMYVPANDVGTGRHFSFPVGEVPSAARGGRSEVMVANVVNDINSVTARLPNNQNVTLNPFALAVLDLTTPNIRASISASGELVAVLAVDRNDRTDETLLLPSSA